MRWYCVSPALPKGAQLRVRTSPSASSPESSGHRLNIYDVVSASSPPLKAPWLQVSWQHSEGYVMASTPDDMALLVPWESTSFVKVVFVYPETELRHETTHETVLLDQDAYLGVISELSSGDDDADLSYVVMYQGEPHIVEQADVVVMAERIHESMRFSMNPDLPDNATIVVRQWPHRDSSQVDVLTHGQVIDGEIRSEDWIKLHEHAWVMWKLASHNNLELLQPVRTDSVHDLPVDADQPIVQSDDVDEDPAMDSSATDDEATAKPEEAGGYGNSGSQLQQQASQNGANGSMAYDDRPIRQVNDERPLASTASSGKLGDSSHHKDEEAAVPLVKSHALAHDDRPIHSVQSAVEPDKEKLTTWEHDRPIHVTKPASFHEQEAVLGSPAIEETAPITQDRPMRSQPVPIPFEDRPIHAAKTKTADDDRPIQSFEDRPIHAAKTTTVNEGHPIQSIEDRPIHAAKTPTVDEEKPIPSFEDRPIHSVKTATVNEGHPFCSFEDQPIHAAKTATVNEGHPFCSFEDQPIHAAKTPTVNDDHPIHSFENRPIHPVETPAVQDQAASSFHEQPMAPTELSVPAVEEPPSVEDRPLDSAKSHESQLVVDIAFTMGSPDSEPSIDKSSDVVSATTDDSTPQDHGLDDRPMRPLAIRFEDLDETVPTLAVSSTDGRIHGDDDQLQPSVDPTPTEAGEPPVELSKLQQLSRDLSDVHLMWSLQVELLDALHPLLFHGMSSQLVPSLTPDDHAAVSAMLQAKLQATLHVKVLPVFLQVALPYLASEIQLPPVRLLPGLLRLFQAKAAQTTLEPFLAKFVRRYPMDDVWNALEQVLVANSDEADVAPVSEMGLARLLVWWSSAMCATDGTPTSASLRLCDALVPFATHRATKVRAAAVDILAFLASHPSSDNGSPSHLDQWLRLQADASVQDAIQTRINAGHSHQSGEGQPPAPAVVVEAAATATTDPAESAASPGDSTPNDAVNENGVAKLIKRFSIPPQRKAKERFAQWKQDRAGASDDSSADASIVVGNRMNDRPASGHVVSFAQWQHHGDVTDSTVSDQVVETKSTPRDKAKSKFAQWKAQQEQGAAPLVSTTSDADGAVNVPNEEVAVVEGPVVDEAVEDEPAPESTDQGQTNTDSPDSFDVAVRGGTSSDDHFTVTNVLESEVAAPPDAAVVVADDVALGHDDDEEEDFLEQSHDLVTPLEDVAAVVPSPMDRVKKSKFAQWRQDNGASSVETSGFAAAALDHVDMSKVESPVARIKLTLPIELDPVAVQDDLQDDDDTTVETMDARRSDRDEYEEAGSCDADAHMHDINGDCDVTTHHDDVVADDDVALEDDEVYDDEVVPGDDFAHDDDVVPGDDVINDDDTECADDVISADDDDQYNNEDDDDDIGNESVEEVDENDEYLTSTCDMASPRFRRDGAEEEDGPDHDGDDGRGDDDGGHAAVARTICFSDVSDDDDEIALLGHHGDDDDEIDEYAIVHQELLDTDLEFEQEAEDAQRDGVEWEELDEVYPDAGLDLWNADHLFMPTRTVQCELARLQHAWSGDDRGYWGAVLNSSPTIVLAANFPDDADVTAHNKLLPCTWLWHEIDAPDCDKEEGLTPADMDAISEYKAQWETARRAVLQEVTPPAPILAPVLVRQVPATVATPSDAEKYKTTPPRLLQRPLSSTSVVSTPPTGPSAPSTPSFLRKPSGLPTKLLPRTLSTPSVAPPPTTTASSSASGIPSTPTTTRQTSMRPPTARTPLGTKGLRTPSSSSRSLSFKREAN